LLKIAFNTDNKYIIKLIIKNKPLRKCTAIATRAVSLSELKIKMCIIIYSSDIKTETLQNSLLSYKDDFLLWHSTRWIWNLHR